MTADRGRVPFALIGVLLVVSSATLAASIDPHRGPAEPAVDAALEGASAATRTALQDAARRAARAAARNPVVEPADTSTGAVLNDSTAFRDALRVRIYHAARQRLRAVEGRRDGVRVTASLAPTPTADALRAAKRRVHVERVGANGTGLRVRVENVTLTVRRDGAIVSRYNRTPTVTVASPVLAMHERVTAYQERLNAGVAHPGLTQQVTAGLYGLAWARGYAQYGGLPIENVVSNRHVSITTNAALLANQRAAIGASDPQGRLTLAEAAASAGANQVLSASGAVPPGVQPPLGTATEPPPTQIRGLDPASGPRRDDERTVGVNRTADAVLSRFDRRGLNATIARAYETRVRLVARSERVAEGTVPPPSAPGPNWTLVDESVTVERSVTVADVAPPETPDGFHALVDYEHQVRTERTWSRTWERGNETRTRRTSATGRVNVAVAVVGRHATSEHGPDNPIAGVHERAGALDGPNLQGVSPRAVRRMVVDRGGSEEIARDVVERQLHAPTRTIAGSRPEGLRAWIYRDLMALRDRVRNVSVSVDRVAVGTYEATPAADLAARIEERRAELLDAPAAYDGVADRARVAARAAYLDRVVAALRARARRRAERAQQFGEALSDTPVGSLSQLREYADAARRATPERGSAVSGPGGTVHLRVDSAPAYLTTAEVTHEEVPAVDDETHPLAARNVNLFTVPHAQVSNSFVQAIMPDDSSARLSAAARTLQAIDGANATDPAARRANESRLREAVRTATGHVRRRLRERLAASGVGDGTESRRAIVTEGLATWNTTAGRALALANGSATPRIAAAAAERADLDAAARDRLRLRLDDARRNALTEDGARPASGAVQGARTLVQVQATRAGRRIANETVQRAVNRTLNRTTDTLPAGLPVAPVPGYWYATVNVWHVQVRGEYARFGVRSTRGRPATPGAGAAYVRDGGVVRLDVDDDDERERLGRSTRVNFSVETAIVVAVPPGRSGVGDTDGVMDERTPGWTSASSDNETVSNPGPGYVPSRGRGPRSPNGDAQPGAATHRTLASVATE